MMDFLGKKEWERLLYETQKRKFITRVHDGLYAFFETLWNILFFKITFIGVGIIGSIWILEVLYPTAFPSFFYTTIGILYLVWEYLESIASAIGVGVLTAVVFYLIQSAWVNPLLEEMRRANRLLEAILEKDNR